MPQAAIESAWSVSAGRWRDSDEQRVEQSIAHGFKQEHSCDDGQESAYEQEDDPGDEGDKQDVGRRGLQS